MNRIVIIIFSWALASNLSAQTWERFYGISNKKESGQDLIECYDKGYLLGTGSNELLESWIIKTDINGELLWEKKFAWNNKDVALTRVDQNSIGEMLSSGFIWWGGGDQWPMLVKMDECGNKLWCRVYLDETYDHGSCKDAILLDNGDVVALIWYESDQNIDQIFLYYINSDGDLEWVQSYSSKTIHPLIMQRGANRLYNFNGEYQISGYCYYPYPTNPGTGYIRPFFIGIDSSFNEKWVLPFGVSDSLYGEAFSLIPLNDSTYMGIGFMHTEGTQNSLLMYINENGDELGYSQITNDQIGPNFEKNIAADAVCISNSLFISSIWLEQDGAPDAFGDVIVDTEGNVYDIEFRENTRGLPRTIVTFNDKYLTTCSYLFSEYNRDVYLYKINDSLDWDSTYSTPFTYDSLCPYTIEPETIDVSNCLVFTKINETPMLDQYRGVRNIIRIIASPNPTIHGEVKLTLHNTDQHEEIELRFFNVYGQHVCSEGIYKHQGEVKMDVQYWRPGIYLVVAFSKGQSIGKSKIIVQ